MFFYLLHTCKCLLKINKYNLINMTGRVIYSSGGNYRVLTKEKIYTCKPIGKFRNEHIKILVGDIVELEVNEDKVGLEEINVIKELHERKNEFVRPNISNVDNAILVTSIVEPNLNDFYLDKLITIFNSRDVEPILIFTKKDLVTDDQYLKVIDEYKEAGFKVLVTNTVITDEQKALLKEWTENKLSVITGQTGVGKSTLLNNINNSFNLATGEISKALGRGKHTTRHSEAFEIFENSYIIDTPGFSSLEITDLTKQDISWNFFNFESKASGCRFSNCLHLSENECKVKEENYSERTINNYKKLLEEV